MLVLHEARVAADEIDSLGHMNMRYYSVRAREGAAALFARWGFGAKALKAAGLTLTVQDSFNHYLAEQFEGASLCIQGGVIDVGAQDVSLYVEIINTGDGKRAATFLLKPVLQESATRRPTPFPASLLASARNDLIDVPAHARPRTLDLAPPRTDLRYEDIARRLPPSHFPGEFKVRVDPVDCDSHGFLKLSGAQDIMMMAFAAVMRARAAAGEEVQQGPREFPVENGVRVAWAMLENRQYLVRTPRAGDLVQTLSAPYQIARKTQTMRRWTFNVETGDLLAVIDGVSIAFDLGARRAIDIPPGIRRELESEMIADLTF